jgi:curli biogenesis system outer membrane secretion channel CsgG
MTIASRFSLIATIFALSLSASAETVTSEMDYALPRCAKPIASVMIGQFTCKSAGCQAPGANQDPRLGGLAALAALAAGGANTTFPGIGEGMAAMVTTALKETGCFELQEREALDELNKELALVGKKVEVQQADFMISGAITSISLATERKSLGGGFIPIVGAISTTTKTADLGMDIKLIDVNKAKIVDAKTFVGNNETSSLSLGAAGFGGGVGAFGGMSNVKGTPMESVVRDVLVRVASFASRSIVAAKGATDVQMIAPAAVSDKK